MARHKEKDDEAGGEGLGILATRKRLWRDAEGNIVNARRPSYTQEGTKRRQLSRSERKGSRTSETDSESSHTQSSSPSLSSPPIVMSRNGSTCSSTIIVDAGVRGFLDNEHTSEELNQGSWLGMEPLPSPPISESSFSEQSPTAELSELDGLYEDTWPVMHDGIPEIVNDSPVMGRSSQYPESPSWAPQPFQTFMGAMAELPYDDIFKPETGLYDWQTYHSMSRCREEKYDPFVERERKWGSSYPGQEIFRKGFGMSSAC